MNSQLLYQIALNFIEDIGPIRAKQLISHFGNAEAIFKESTQALSKLPSIGAERAAAIKKKEVLERAEKEIAFIESKNIKTYFYTDSAYPYRLKECADSPLMLYGLGNLHPDNGHLIAIVGTRKPTDRGKSYAEKLIKELSERMNNITIISGLAYGIDICAHRAALATGVPTIGIPAHGLDTIYPSSHRNTAAQMLEKGGILTEFCSKTIPEAGNFVRRNRIIAGLSDAVIIVESKEKGGSLITANYANGYNRDVFAFPGRADDKESAGCNQLIKRNIAALIENADDLIRYMNWDLIAQNKQPVQTQLFDELTDTERRILEQLRSHGDGLHINELALLLQMPFSSISAELITMEFKGLVRALPGSIYRAV